MSLTEKTRLTGVYRRAASTVPNESSCHRSPVHKATRTPHECRCLRDSLLSPTSRSLKDNSLFDQHVPQGWSSARVIKRLSTCRHTCLAVCLLPGRSVCPISSVGQSVSWICPSVCAFEMDLSAGCMSALMSVCPCVCLLRRPFI